MFDAPFPVPALTPSAVLPAAAPPVVEAPEVRYAVRYVLLTEPSPGLLPRVLGPLAKRDLTPELFRARRLGPALRVEVAVAVGEELIHRIEGDLRRVVGVSRLEVERGRLLA